MKCLSRIEMQEFIDKETIPAVETGIIQHIESCEKCSSLYKKGVEDKAMINKLLDKTESDDGIDYIPEFKVPIPRGKKFISYTIFPLIAAALMIGFILVFRINREPVTIKIPEDEIILYEYIDGLDLNKLWHEKTQIPIILDDQGNVIQSIITN